MRGLWLLLGLTALVYLPVLQADFVWDDHWLILQNSYLTGSLPSLLRADFAAFAQLPGQVGYWRPLLMLDFWVDQQLFGTSSALFWHLHSLFWHLTAVALLHRLLLPKVGTHAALAGCAILALHPTATEAVAWVSARNDPMCATLMLLAILALQVRHWSGGLWILAALGVKESALLILPWQEVTAKPSWKGRLLVACLLIAGLLLRPLLGITSLPSPTLSNLQALATSLPALLDLIGKKLWGLSNGTTHHLAYLQNAPVFGIFLGFSLMVLLRRAPGGLLLVALGIVPGLLATAQTGVFGDRYLYLSLVALAFSVGMALKTLNWARLQYGVATVLLLAATIQSSRRLLDWQDDVELFRAEVASNPNPYNQQLLGGALLSKGQYAESYKVLLPLLSEHPPFPELYANGLASALKTGHYAEAVAFGTAGGPEHQDAGYHGRYAIALAAEGYWEEAEKWAEVTEKESPGGAGTLVKEAVRGARGAPISGDAAKLLSLGQAAERVRTRP